ncbi:MAG: enoyl-CoA hydratase/isomerase family protein [Alphaproteobacteria bacterium]|jgi:enoyl-CoA hydratase|nr:enoyl-CoA hydratase/isomerase family protein [Alphaproteobacteria bacterium]
MARNRISLSVENGIATILLDRPEVLNALDQVMWEELVAAVRGAAIDPDVRVAIVTGEGRGFCVGADLKETSWRGESQDQSRRRIERNNQQLAREMVGAPIPIIAAINGYALGGGVEIALAADMRIAAVSARFGFPETTIGRFISGGASLLLPKVVGIAWAKRMIYTGAQVDAVKAEVIGLVEEVVPNEDLQERAMDLARTIASNAPVSIALAKRVLDRVSIGDLETALAFETEGLLATYATDDNERGVAAFAKREAPEFEGR